jgi:signal transduction histidine kinase
VHLAFKLPNEPLLIEFDLSQFELAILNIASNARDAMPEGGTFEIAVVQYDPTTVTLVLTDSGMGMSEQTKARIFEPFFTTKPVGSGTGVGLTVVYNLIRNADGNVEVESEIGKGTVFRICFPLAKALRPGRTLIGTQDFEYAMQTALPTGR